MTDLIVLALACTALALGLALFALGAADLMKRTRDMQRVGKGRL